MTPLVEFAPESLLCYAAHVVSLPDWFTSGRRCFAVGEIRAYDVTGDGSALKRLRSFAIDELPRVMDHFYLWTPRSLSDGRQQLLDALFETTAPDFEHIIHSDQNRDNIRQLVRIIAERYDEGQELRVLDFGCGPGLSAEIAFALEMVVVGYDRCPKMRAAAVQRGLRVITPDEFGSLPAISFDAAFASYVFHFGPSQADLSRLWELVRPGGVIVANFHKDHGLTEITCYFEALGAETKIVTQTSSRFRHGSYRAYVRR